MLPERNDLAPGAATAQPRCWYCDPCDRSQRLAKRRRRQQRQRLSQAPCIVAREMGWPIPQTLSPSSMGAFTSCPLAFRFSYVQRLPEPPSAPASKGTLVHLALQHLMWRPAEDRTIDAALADLDRARAELSSDAEFSGLQLNEDEWD